MFENITKFLKKFNKKDNKVANNSREAAKERLHLVLMQDRANVSADFLELMKQEIIEVIKKYIDVDESAIDVRLTNKENADGTNGAPALYANIPILNIKNEARKMDAKKDNVNKENIKKTEKEQNSKPSKEDNDIKTKNGIEEKELGKNAKKLDNSKEETKKEENTESKIKKEKVEIEKNEKQEEIGKTELKQEEKEKLDKEKIEKQEELKEEKKGC